MSKKNYTLILYATISLCAIHLLMASIYHYMTTPSYTTSIFDFSTWSYPYLRTVLSTNMFIMFTGISAWVITLITEILNKNKNNELKNAQKEIDKLNCKINELNSVVEKEIENRDNWEERATNLAESVADYFDSDIGEHSSANCPIINAHRLLATKPECRE